MLENYKKLIKCIEILQGFENYRMSNGYGARLKPFSYIKLLGSITYNAGKLSIRDDKGIEYQATDFLHQDRNRTSIASNKLRVGSKISLPTPYLNIQFSDDYIQITSPALFRYDLELQDLFEEEAHFQYSMLDDIPSVEVLKEAHEIFEMLLNEDIGYIGPLELPEIDYDGFLRWMRDQTTYVSGYWELLDV